jgi:hypothetical protein
MIAPNGQPLPAPLFDVNRPTIMIRIAKWISQRSYWVIALSLVLPTVAIIQFGFLNRADGLSLYLPLTALFLPDAVRQLSWRKGLLIALIAVVVAAIDSTAWNVAMPYPLGLIAWFSPVIGACHWAFNPPRKRRFLAWTLGLTAAVAFLIPAIVEPVRYVNLTTVIPIRGGERILDPTYTLYWLLLAVSIWTAITVAENLANSDDLMVKSLTAIGFAACGTWFFLFFEVLIYPIATWSLAGDRLFDRSYAAKILETHYGSDTEQVFWKTLESANWSKSPDLDDYRRTCINVLFSRHPSAAAQRLALLLRQKPSAILAAYAAPILAQERRYDAAPELMRYALLDGNDATAALESMHVPQAALAVLRQQAFTEALVSGRAEDPNSPIGANYERRLAGILGKDIGPNRNDWLDFYKKVVEQLPTPLSLSQARETDRVAKAILSYFAIAGRLQRTGRFTTIPSPNLDVAGSTALEHEIQQYNTIAEEREKP